MKSNNEKTPRADAKPQDRGGALNKPKASAANVNTDDIGGDEHGRDIVAEAQGDRGGDQKRDPNRDPKKPNQQPTTKPSDSAGKPTHERQGGQGKPNQQPNPSR